MIEGTLMFIQKVLKLKFFKSFDRTHVHTSREEREKQVPR